MSHQSQKVPDDWDPSVHNGRLFVGMLAKSYFEES